MKFDDYIGIYAWKKKSVSCVTPVSPSFSSPPLFIKGKFLLNNFKNNKLSWKLSLLSRTIQIMKTIQKSKKLLSIKLINNKNEPLDSIGRCTTVHNLDFAELI